MSRTRLTDDMDLSGHRLLDWRWLDDLPTTGASSGQVLAFNGSSVVWATMSATGFVSTDWGSLANVPTEFPPEDHTHLVAEITNFPATWAYTDLTGVPAEFPPSTHTHTLADITDYSPAAGGDLFGSPADFGERLAPDPEYYCELHVEVLDFGARDASGSIEYGANMGGRI